MFRPDKKSIQSTLVSVLSVLIFISIWEWVSIKELINPLFIGRPSQVITEFFGFLTSQDFWLAYKETISALSIGLLIATSLGLLIGIISGINRYVNSALRPYIYTISSIPTLAFLPIIIIWFGVGGEAKIFVIVLFSIVPIVINVVEGVHSVDKKLLDMAKSFSASQFFVVKKIIIFEIIPYFVSGLRNAIGKAMIGVIVAEFFGLGQGIGYLISFYGQTYKTDKFMALMLVALVTSLVLILGIKVIEKRIKKWGTS
jgi:NitT/TauT family transport system permease protein